MNQLKSFLLILTFICVSTGTLFAQTQFGEPEVQKIEDPRNLYDEGYKFGLGFNFGLNDFGFGAGVQLRQGLSSYTEAILNLKIAGLRDPSEQTYIDYYFGNRTIPSKYKRIIAFPMTIGLKQRLFPKQISDNFRFHTSLSLGAAYTVILPYFNDANNNQFREASPYDTNGGNNNGTNYVEPIYDIFQGWDQSENKWGWTGELVFGVDFGDNFSKLQTIQFGYNFYYFPDGLQILEPVVPERGPNGLVIDENGDYFADRFNPANDPISYFGSAQISFIFGWMW